MSPWFLTLLIWAVFFVASELLRPKPKFEDARPAGLGDFRFPTATEGRVVPIVWGRVKIEGPNVVWYGDVRNEAITKEVKTGVFSSDTITTGYRYFVGLQFALCRGPVDRLINIWVDDVKVMSNDMDHGDRNWIDAPNAFGGEEFGAGGMHGVVGFYEGNKTQVLDTYLAGQQDPDIGYRGTCYVVYEGGYHGTSTSIQPWAFEVERIPDGLGLATYDPGSEVVNSYDVNPVNVIFEILTDTDWGLGIPIGQIDLTNFREIGSILASEGNGFSMLLDSAIEAEELIKELSRQIDGSVYFARDVGLWRIVLARDDYNPGVLETYDETNISELMDYARTTWDETTNQVRVNFVDRSDEYKETYALAQDMANFNIQGVNITADENYPGVKDKVLANSLAWRDLRTLSYPLAKITFTVNRRGFNLFPGSVFKFTWARLGVAGIVFRVGRITPGKIEDGKIEIFAVQDIFSTGIGVFGDPLGSGWTTPELATVPVNSDDTLIFEAPRQMVAQDPYSSSLEPRVWMGARSPGGGTNGFRAYTKIGPSRPLFGSFVADASISAFLKTGTLETALEAYSTENWPDNSYEIRVNNNDPDDLVGLVIDGNSTNVEDLMTILMIEDEFIGYETVIEGTGIIRISHIYRGLFSSYPKAHAIGSTVWFIGQTGGNLTIRTLANSDDEMDIQLRSRGISGEVTEAVTPIEQIPTLTRLWERPLPPRNPKFNNTLDPASVSLDTLYTTETGRTGENASAVKITVLPRCWRINSVIRDHYLSESLISYLSDQPELSFQLVLDPGGTPINVPAIVAIDPENPVVYVLRNSIIEAVGANTPIPTTANLIVTPSHEPLGFTSPVDGPPMEYPFAVTSELIGQELMHGAIVGGDVASAAVIYGETGTYNFNIYTALPTSGRLQARINAGSWVTVVASAATTGTLAVTTGDSVELRFDVAPALDQFFIVTGPTTESGYGVLLA